MQDLVKLFGLFGLAGSVALAAACSATGGGSVFGEDDDGGNATGSGGAGGHASTSNGIGGDLGLGGMLGQGGSSGPGMSTCDTQNDGTDGDMDGFPDPIDCNDCDPNVNPNAVEVGDVGAGGSGGMMYVPADENCDGVKDEPKEICDQGLAVADEDPLNAARAVDLCKMSTGPDDWGVVSAKWVMADGSPPPGGQLANFHLGHGLVSGFGPNVTPRYGERMLGVSSGSARQPTDVGYMPPGGFSKGYNGLHPQGFPKESAACPGTITGTPYDPTGVEIEIRAPSNALGFSFNFDFYTYEWPVYICSQYNDFFVALLSPIPQGQLDGNIVFDMQGNPISVNNAFMDVCGCSNGPPCNAGGKVFPCPLGTAELTGTGFEQHAATSWLKTSAPVEPNQVIIIRWAAYDSGDGVLDSTALIDNWEWIATPGTEVGTVKDPPEDPM